ncbi:neutral zinc metallopeptidase [Rhodococcus sp. IEGM 1379]|uniref:KPN_02809 family neutral zinc metallopeptidase n=1 Tax=Rhodococcus sp. IEGM 1379 TaxID=3047086 RepID=UPI0024B72D42|nr:neutral zinc metallopeptidase [Rhodococcus sp. IEGM 1379]MDI9915810.1 neutral zinc metallopeptidase [Rhodococcus sp. IEGM 1379]
MTFNEGARGEAGRVQVQGSGGGSRGSKMAIGGGAGGIIVLILALLFGGDPGSLLGGLSSSTDSASSSTGLASVDDCTGTQANNDVNCRVAFTVGSLDDVWEQQLIKQTGTKYVRPEVVLFSGSVNTGCGQASSDVGPFYCPADQTAYFDTSFFQLLVDRFGSSAGPLAQEYVVAHEFGHHLQNQLGDISRAQSDPQGAQSGAVRTELQADCYAGVWAHYADTIPDQATGQPFLKPLTQTDIRDALSAASSVGDDRIQKASTGRVNPEGWTHGSSDQRQKWFAAGYTTGQVSACDTYSARDLNNPPALVK